MLEEIVIYGVGYEDRFLYQEQTCSKYLSLLPSPLPLHEYYNTAI